MTTKLYLIIPVLLTGCMSPDTANIDGAQNNPDLAQSFDYCDWAFTQDGKATAVSDFNAARDQAVAGISPNKWSERLVEAGSDIARAQSSKDSCKAAFSEGQKSFDDQLKASLKNHRSQAKYKKKKDTQIADIQAQMAMHWVEDQAARRVYLAAKTDDKTGAEFWTRSLAAAHTNNTDARSTNFMKDLLKQYDWIDNERFGERISMGAWLMVQHADDHVELQSLALSRMEPYLKSGGVSKGDYAFLWDRVAVNTGKMQRYGTQPTWECTPDGQLTLQPLEDPENVNARREAMTLGTVEEGLAEMARSVCG